MTRTLAALLLCLATAAPSLAGAAPSHLIVWAWERPEDLRFLPPDTEIAVQTGFIELSGDQVLARARRFPLKARPGQVTTAVVHVQIDPRRPLVWSPAQRREAARQVLRLGQVSGVSRLQLDFEVRASQRSALRALVQDTRATLPSSSRLSITALASWCGEGWLDALPVDEAVPMLFRMGRGGEAIRDSLWRGEDFVVARCRKAMAISTDTPIARAPAGRRVYLFNPRSWTAGDFALAKRRVSAWDAP